MRRLKGFQRLPIMSEARRSNWQLLSERLAGVSVPEFGRRRLLDAV